MKLEKKDYFSIFSCARSNCRKSNVDRIKINNICYWLDKVGINFHFKEIFHRIDKIRDLFVSSECFVFVSINFNCECD